MGWTHETTHWHKHICANTSEDGLGVAGLGCIEFVVLYGFNTTHTQHKQTVVLTFVITNT